MKKTILNHMKLEIDAKSENESFARTTVAAFAAQLDPTVEEINDLKTAVSEAVTNCVVHAYGNFVASETVKSETVKSVVLDCALWKQGGKRGISITVTDFGVGISNIERALEPFYTTKPEQERSGMGFTVMQSFMDTLKVKSGRKGTVVEMQKFFQCAK